MKKIFFIFVALFSITACSDPVVDCDPNADELCLKNYVGWFYQYGPDKIPTLIITKVGNVFHILNKDSIGGEYLCTFDGRIMEDWGGGPENAEPVMLFDCRVLSSLNNSMNDHFPTPYIKLQYYIKDYDGVDYNKIYYTTYFRGKEYYKKCSAEDNKQACISWSNSFFFGRPLKPK